MGNKVVILRIWRLLKKKILVILISMLLGGVFSYFISTYFLQKKYSSSIQIVYVIENTALKDEVTAKTTLLKTYKRMMYSNINLKETQEIFMKQTGHLLSLNTLKNMITITQEQDELLLTIKVEATSPENAAVLADGFAQSSIAFIKTIYNPTEQLKIVSKAQINEQSIYPKVIVNTTVGAIVGFIFSVSILFIQAQFAEIRKRREAIHGVHQ
jgi:capsular polysaccharide biosynthesis protein